MNAFREGESICSSNFGLNRNRRRNRRRNRNRSRYRHSRRPDKKTSRLREQNKKRKKLRDWRIDARWFIFFFEQINDVAKRKRKKVLIRYDETRTRWLYVFSRHCARVFSAIFRRYFWFLMVHPRDRWFFNVSGKLTFTSIAIWENVSLSNQNAVNCFYAYNICSNVPRIIPLLSRTTKPKSVIFRMNAFLPCWWQRGCCLFYYSSAPRAKRVLTRCHDWLTSCLCRVDVEL